MTELLTNLTATHPLDRLSEAETEAGVAIIKNDERFGDRMRFGSVNLLLPSKQTVLDFVAGDPVERGIEAIILDNSRRIDP
jgi:Cu2+-containing amine oxidase